MLVLSAPSPGTWSGMSTPLNATRWNRKQAAALLQVDYKALLYKMKKLGVESNSPVLLPTESVEPPKKMAASRH